MFPPLSVCDRGHVVDRRGGQRSQRGRPRAARARRSPGLSRAAGHRPVHRRAVAGQRAACAADRAHDDAVREREGDHRVVDLGERHDGCRLVDRDALAARASGVARSVALRGRDRSSRLRRIEPETSCTSTSRRSCTSPARIAAVPAMETCTIPELGETEPSGAVPHVPLIVVTLAFITSGNVTEPPFTWVMATDGAVLSILMRTVARRVAVARIVRGRAARRCGHAFGGEALVLPRRMRAPLRSRSSKPRGRRRRSARSRSGSSTYPRCRSCCQPSLRSQRSLAWSRRS